MELNSKQEEAKNKIEWPLLIIAWAWSWKTATLTARVQYMIEEKGINPSNILMVTFTNKAASEMRKRVASTLGIETPRNIYSKTNFPLIWTFHSIWIFILKSVLLEYLPEELNIWIKKNFIIYDEQDKISVLKNILKNKLNIDEKEFPARQISFYISNAKNNLLTARWYEKEVDSALKEVVFKAYIEYEKEIELNNAMDFDDILIKMHLILKIPKILEKYQEKYKFLMVDEYQDTNLVQYKIVNLLASKYRNLAVVWDDSQSIYSWRWADMTNIINFKKDYNDVLIIKLEQNYRSTKKIIAWANAVIWNNNFWIKKNLWTENKQWEHINYIEAPTDKTEASIIVDIIKNKQWDYKDNLILYRTNAQSRLLEEALLIKNIPYRVIWWQKFYERKEIKDLLAYLKVIFNQDDIVSSKRIINTPPRKIWAKSISILDEYRNNFNIPYTQIISNIDEVEELNNWAKASIKNFKILLDELIVQSHKINVSDLIREIVKKTQYDIYLTQWLSQDEKEAKLQNIDEIINIASEYNWIEPRESLWLFLEEIALLTDMDLNENKADYVTLMTIHTSKGLEEKRVFLTWLEDWIFPSFRSLWDTSSLEEERRLMYVAMTRAKEELYISRAKERFHFWDYVRNPKSRFLNEIPSEYVNDYDLGEYIGKNNFFNVKLNNNIKFETSDLKHDQNSKIVRKIQNNDISQFNVWDKILHPKFWEWIITEISWEIGSLAFNWQWIKKMNIKIAPIKKF